MTTNMFSYNGLDARTSLIDSTGTKTFKRAGVGVTAPVLSDGTASFPPSGEKRGSVKTTFYSALKNDDMQTNSSQTITANKQFDAFGNEVSSTGTWRSQFGYAGGFRYQSDPDSGLKLLGHRYYDSSTGRFLTRDPIKDGRNLFTYCSNSPVTHHDAKGLYRVVVINDNTGVPGGDTLGGIVADIRDDDIVFQGKDVDKNEILWAMVFADEFYFYGHGTPDGDLLLSNGDYITQQDIAWVLMMRQLVGKGKMTRAELRACFSCRAAQFVNLWLQMASKVKGFSDLTVEWAPPRINPIIVWKSPITKDPGRPYPNLDGTKKEPSYKDKKGRKRSGKGKPQKTG